ncbi:MAG: beta-N-acetylhexosaminidase [Prevotellaceae bacterium]|jgi:hexosaminidase|nr:beta-N-acetylhexosaminidase [Prevotellaceae bacterium]
MKKYLLLFVLLIITSGMFAQTPGKYNVIPMPAKLKRASGEFVFNQRTQLIISDDTEAMRNAIAPLTDRLRIVAGFIIPVVHEPNPATQSNTVVCKLNKKNTNNEGYELTVKKNSILVEAQTPQGIFYAMQTLRQLMPAEIDKSTLIEGIKWTVPCVEITDAPRFVYRGLHLDVSRHFFPIEFVKNYIDWLAYHKINTFHWHLTDDQGWRIEIKKYPKLTETGAWRCRTLKGAYKNNPCEREWDNTTYGGYYTQEEIKTVVEYAAKRFVTIVPEIEIPGHAVAALTAYPELSCSGGPFEVEGLWGVFEDIFCTRDEVFNFLEDVLVEVIALFPGKYIHIGGDEAPKVRWERCHACQTNMKELGLKDEHELQSYFVQRIEKFIESKGRSIIGWDEILEGGLAPNATVMSWRGEKGGIEAAKQKHSVIMTPNTYVYFDYYQVYKADRDKEPHSIGGELPIDKVYQFDPMPKELSIDEQKYILGGQANLWTEYMKTPEHVEYMAYPRVAALSECIWSNPERKNYDDFIQRLTNLVKHYDELGINYSKAFLRK